MYSYNRGAGRGFAEKKIESIRCPSCKALIAVSSYPEHAFFCDEVHQGEDTRVIPRDLRGCYRDLRGRYTNSSSANLNEVKTRLNK